MNFYEGDKVRTCNEISAKDRDILKANGIKPGTKGVVLSEVTLVTVNFNGKVVTVSDLALEWEPLKKINNDTQVDYLKNMFGMK